MMFPANQSLPRALSRALSRCSLAGFALALLLLISSSSSSPCDAAANGGKDEKKVKSDSDIAIELSNPGQSLELTTPLTILDDKPLKGALTTSQLSELDQKNMEFLWLSVLRQNPTIQYALRQLNMPDDIRRHHKSLMARTMSGLLSGVGMLPYAFGSSATSVSAAAVTQNASSHLMSKADKIDPKTLPTDAELVALASTVESVRVDLLQYYLSYKAALDQLQTLDAQRYALSRFDAKTKETPAWEDDVLGQMQRQQVDADTLRARQRAEMSYLRLERLVGVESMKTLSFVALPVDESIDLEASDTSNEASESSEAVEFSPEPENKGVLE